MVGWNCSIIQDLRLAEALESAGIAFTPDTGSEEFVPHAIHADMGISGVDYALARHRESGRNFSAPAERVRRRSFRRFTLRW